MKNLDEESKAVETLIVTRLAQAHQIPLTESLIKVWLDALEIVDDLQLAHSVYKMFLQGKVARPENRKGWMPTPEEFVEAYHLERERRRKEEASKLQLPPPEKKGIPMPPEVKEALEKLTAKWSMKPTKSA